MAREESTQPQVSRIVSGHFREGPEYSTWRSRGTADYLLIHTYSGAGRIGGEGGELVVTEGHAVLLRPGVRHDYSTDPAHGRWEFGFAHFHPTADWMPLLAWPVTLGWLGHIHSEPEAHRRVSAALRRSTRTHLGGLVHGERFALNALEEALLWLDTQNPLTSRTDERVLRVTEHVGAHLADSLSVETLAALVHLSPSRLTHLFTEHLGISPQRYVERERMLLAQNLLDLTNRSVADIARYVGCDDPLYFSRRFHRFAGVSPTQWRARTPPR
jgi:AraC family transcriptional regulator of arabinose operon